jgi:hypothetical protein
LCRRAYFIKALLFPAFSFLPSESFQVLLAFLYAFRVSFLKVKLLLPLAKNKKKVKHSPVFFFLPSFFYSPSNVKRSGEACLFFSKSFKKEKRHSKGYQKRKSKKEKGRAQSFL